MLLSFQWEETWDLNFHKGRLSEARIGGPNNGGPGEPTGKSNEDRLSQVRVTRVWPWRYGLLSVGAQARVVCPGNMSVLAGTSQPCLTFSFLPCLWISTRKVTFSPLLSKLKNINSYLEGLIQPTDGHYLDYMMLAQVMFYNSSKNWTTCQHI